LWRNLASTNFDGVEDENMKALSVICVVCLSASWASAQQNRFVEIPEDYYTATYDLDTVKFITPGRFTIVRTEIDDPDVMKFELNALPILRQYCGRPAGKYPAPAELLQLGPPDLPVEEIKVSSHKIEDDPQFQHKEIEWKYPYRRMLPKTGWLDCRVGDETEEQLYHQKEMEMLNGTKRKEIYDCRRGLRGYVVERVPGSTMFPEDTPHNFHPMYQGSYGVNYYRTICRAVMHEEPNLPPPQ
jgi:hypothetical protein